MSEALFASQSAPYANFKTVGTTHKGTIIRTSQTQARKYVLKAQRDAGVQGDLEFWPDGRPKMIPIVTIQTAERDPDIEGDDGQRSIWISGKSMTKATEGAVRTAGAVRRGLEVDGWFSMTFTHETPPEEEGLNPTKHYQVSYVLPENNPFREQVEPDDDLIVAPATPVNSSPKSPPPPSQPQAPAAAPAAAPNPGGVDLSSLDLTTMSPEAVAALQVMLNAQQGGGQRQ